jgi:hypothetical protein
MSDNRIVYVSGPYSTGKWGANVRNAIDAAEYIRCETENVYPFVPHTMSALWSLVYPGLDHDDWMELDLAFVERCDALLRLDGESPGGDEEVAFARELDIPRYYDVENLVADAYYGDLEQL